jgi:predicted dehydrogenase
MEEGRLDPLPLVTHRFAFADALSAYELVTSSDPGLGILLQYPEHDSRALASGRLVERAAAPHSRSAGVVGCIGAGNFASRMLIPAFAKAGATLRTIVSSGGVSGAIAGNAHNFARVASENDAVLGDQAIDIAVIATRHDSHARLVVESLRAGKHVFVEKPLALHEDDVDEIEGALAASGRILAVGFNRRFAPLTVEARRALSSRVGPLAVVMTVNAGALPDDHWTRHPEVGGGRVVGEGCHFIDLARCLVDHPIRDVEVVAASTRNAPSIEDVSSIHIRFDDGSWAAIHYLANGNRQFPKERVELFWDGKTLRIDNFRRLEGWGVPSQGRWLGGRQDKGHAALVDAFVKAVREGTTAPIPSAELFEVSRWAIRAGRAAAGLRA